MPYVSEENRRHLNDCIDNMADVLKQNNLEFHNVLGNINYCFSRVLSQVMGDVSYSKIAMATGVLENIKQEFYRRIGVSLEDKKIIENGDIPEYKRLC